jgi:Na+-driven multidrug efflux pump
LLFSIPLAVFLTQATDLGRTGIWIAFLASSAVGTLGMGARIATGRWTRRARFVSVAGAGP